MATTQLGDNTVHTVGELPATGSTAPDFTLTGDDFADVVKTSGKRTVLNIFPSIGTGVCQTGVRRFNELAAGLDNTEVICVSQDLPFAMASFCSAEGIDERRGRLGVPLRLRHRLRRHHGRRQVARPARPRRWSSSTPTAPCCTPS